MTIISDYKGQVFLYVSYGQTMTYLLEILNTLIERKQKIFSFYYEEISVHYLLSVKEREL